MNRLHKSIAGNHVKIVKRMATYIKRPDSEARSWLRKHRPGYEPMQLRQHILEGKPSKLRSLARKAIDRDRDHPPFCLSAHYDFRALAYLVLHNRVIPDL